MGSKAPKPNNVFDKGKGKRLSAEELATMQAMPDDELCVYNVCPNACTEISVAEKGTGGWISFNVIGAEAGEIPPLPNFKPEWGIHFEGGATLHSITVSAISEIGAAAVAGMIKGEKSDDTDTTLVNASVGMFKRNFAKLVELWGAIISRAGPLLLGVPPEVTWAIAMTSERLQFNPGDIALHEGARDDCDDVLIVDDGYVNVEKSVGKATYASVKNVRIGRLGPGAIIGDACLIGAGVPRGATIRAETQVEVLRIPAQAFQDIMWRFPGLVEAFGTRLRKAASAV